MKYYINNGIHIAEVPVDDFRIVMCDSRKKTAAKQDYCNAGFFAVYKEGGENFTLPVGFTVCDYAASSKYVKKYCTERGKFIGDKYYFDSGKFPYQNQFYGHAVSSLVVKGGRASISDISTLPADATYVLSGVPIIRNGADVKFRTYVTGQGWDASTLYGTWHIFAGLKNDSKTIYMIGMRTYSGNMITSAEAYKKLKPLGFLNIIKLDGGGSFHLNANGKTVASTAENRRINTIICFDGQEGGKESVDKPSTSTNPYREPTVAIRRGCTNKESVKWLQWQLINKGYSVSSDGKKMSVDGSFGSITESVLMRYQKANGLGVDGSCGPATRASLKK